MTGSKTMDNAVSGCPCTARVQLGTAADWSAASPAMEGVLGEVDMASLGLWNCIITTTNVRLLTFPEAYSCDGGVLGCGCHKFPPFSVHRREGVEVSGQVLLDLRGRVDLIVSTSRAGNLMLRRAGNLMLRK